MFLFRGKFCPFFVGEIILNSQNLATITNFYYSLLISVLIHKKYAITPSSTGQKKHILTWLTEAKRKKVFDKVVLKEIAWLHEELPRRNSDQLELMLNKSKRLARTVLIFTERSDQLSRATDRVPGLPASPGYVQ